MNQTLSEGQREKKKKEKEKGCELQQAAEAT